MCEKKDTGAVVEFTGIVRSEDGTIWGLDYESYDELAIKEIERLKEEAIEKFGIFKAEIQQKIGRIQRIGPYSLSNWIYSIFVRRLFSRR